MRQLERDPRVLGQTGREDERLPRRWLRFWWRLVKHRHVPFHPGPYRLWYCGRCCCAVTRGPSPDGTWAVHYPVVKYNRRDPR